MTEIRTKRLTLRPIRVGDENEIHEYAGDKSITMMFYLPNETFEETADFVKRNAEEWESEDQSDFAFVILLNGKIIGGCDCDLGHSEDRSYATLGWIINKNYRNNGYASEAASALLDFAFENLGIDKVYAQCDINNQASFGVMRNIGMKCVDDKGTRTYPRTGIVSGEYTCLITRDEWMRKTVETGGITYIEPVTGATNEWYFGMDNAQGDLYEAEEIFRLGHAVKGRKLCLVHYPDGQVFDPVPKAEGHYSEKPVFYDGGIYIIDVDFPGGSIRIVRFDCNDHRVSIHAELPLASVKDCYNLQLHIAPLTLSRQRGSELEIVWPEKIKLSMDDHDSFFMRDGGKLFFNRWHEEGDGADYRYWEETVIRDLDGTVVEDFPGDVMRMPNGKIWYLK